MEEFKWEKMPTPTVTKCCRSLNHAQVLAAAPYGEVPANEGGGDLCYKCMKVDPDGIRLATAEDLRYNGINVSDERFLEMYNFPAV